MISGAFVEEFGNGRMQPEMGDLAAELKRRGLSVTLFTEKQLQRRRLALSRETLVAGTIPSVLLALRYLEIEPPLPNCYPERLAPFLHRRVWTSTVGDLITYLYTDQGDAVFAKPRDRMKRFTGTVFTSVSDLMHLEGASRRTPIYCSEVVDWQSEWRVFILKGDIIGMRPYAGDHNLSPDETVLRKAIAQWEASQEAHHAYAIDFGVLRDGSTALIELNDGFSLGGYGLSPALYTDLTLARWEELTALPSPPNATPE